MENYLWNAIPLQSLPIAKRRDQVPDFLGSIIDRAIESLEVHRIWIFGSRARGDAHKLSDYDLAFEFPMDKMSQWGAFVQEALDKSQTLLPIDLVNYALASETLQKKIQVEGIILYER